MLNPRLNRRYDLAIVRSLSQWAERPPPAAAPRPLAVALGAVILRLRLRAGLSQQQLADRLGVNRSAVSRWERGLRYPTVSHLALVGELVGHRASSMLIEAEEMLLGQESKRPGGEVDDAADH